MGLRGKTEPPGRSQPATPETAGRHVSGDPEELQVRHPGPARQCLVRKWQIQMPLHSNDFPLQTRPGLEDTRLQM